MDGRPGHNYALSWQVVEPFFTVSSRTCHSHNLGINISFMLSVQEAGIKKYSIHGKDLASLPRDYVLKCIQIIISNLYYSKFAKDHSLGWHYISRLEYHAKTKHGMYSRTCLFPEFHCCIEYLNNM